MSTCGRCCRSTNAKALARTISSAFNDLVSRLTPELLRKPITYRNSVGDQFTSTIEDILTHVAMHAAYHRGQIAALLRAGGDHPQPDRLHRLRAWRAHDDTPGIDELRLSLRRVPAN